MSPRARGLCLAGVALVAFLWIALSLGVHPIAHENGLMENQQALCLALAALSFIAAACRQSTRAGRLFCVSLALFCFTFLMRELEIRSARVPNWLESMLTGKGRRIWLSVSWVIMLFIARDCLRNMFSIFVRWVRTPAGLVMIAGGIFYAVTWPFDKRLFHLETSLNVFLEELGDSIATMLLLLSGVWTWRAVSSYVPSNPSNDAGRATVEIRNASFIEDKARLDGKGALANRMARDAARQSRNQNGTANCRSETRCKNQS